MTGKKPINIAGVTEGYAAPAMAKLLNKEAKQGLIIVSSQARAKKLAEDLSFYLDKKIYVVSEAEDLFIRYEARSRERLFERMRGLSALRRGEECVVITTSNAANVKLPPCEIFEENVINISRGQTIDVEDVKDRLVKMGYERVNLIEGQGQFAIRGPIIDIYSADWNNPCRVELFDVEIDSIRSFDIDTQRSIENLKDIIIYPASAISRDQNIFDNAASELEREYTAYIKRQAKKLTELEKNAEIADNKERIIAIKERLGNLEQRRNQLVEYIRTGINLQLLENYLNYFYSNTQHMWDYLNRDGIIIIDDPKRIEETISVREKELANDFEVMLEKGLVIPKDAEYYGGFKDFIEVYSKPNVVIFTPFKQKIKGIESFEALYEIQGRPTPVFSGRLDFFEEELKNYIKRDYCVTIVCSTKERQESLKEFVDRNGLLGKVSILQGNLVTGVDYVNEKVCYIPDKDIFSTSKKVAKRSSKKEKAKKINVFIDLHQGDYVVHENHGIGKFLGVIQKDVLGTKKDYIKIKYAGEDMLFVPVEQMDRVQKYIGSEGTAPKINRLSSGEWKATKAKAKAAIVNMAQELLELTAARMSTKGYSFSPDTEWQKEFEDSFPYVETEDQLRCIKEIKKDMEAASPMDRLLCGDVGFGKTEVAARAVFKCVADGKQAAILVPTTLLANQHYYTLKERFEKFPFKVEVLSRFRTDRQQDEIVTKIEKGQIDVVIGTHRLLSKDVKFKDLGLLVVDEEQRFGVEHKEKIKLLKQNVDVLTLSATPIPRTLHMSLVDIRDMSLIEEPPEERYPVQTYVLEQDEQTIKEVIERELARDGQVYVLFNKVRGIIRIKEMIEELVPEAEVVVGHGQMNEGQLEKVMMGFIRKESNVLVSTTIIESGIDIPNVNTIIILDADKLGLSQLYQIRGRVGRSNKLAYAYLMYEKDKALSEVAEKRLKAIKEFTEFGAGFKVAMRDLEIRGAGNLLGTQQSGHIMKIGYELYCKLVDDAVRFLNGEVVNSDRDETNIQLNVAAYIPEGYIQDEILKLNMYKKIALISTAEDQDEMIDELLDRFGDVPKETLNLIMISRIKSMAEEISVEKISESVEMKTRKITLHFPTKQLPEPKKLQILSKEYGARIFVHGGVKPFIRYTVKGASKDMLTELVQVMEKII